MDKTDLDYLERTKTTLLSASVVLKLLVRYRGVGDNAAVGDAIDMLADTITETDKLIGEVGT